MTPSRLANIIECQRASDIAYHSSRQHRHNIKLFRNHAVAAIRLQNDAARLSALARKWLCGDNADG